MVDRWGGEIYLWHRMLAQRGYIVLSMDNRGTPAPRGRAWRKGNLLLIHGTGDDNVHDQNCEVLVDRLIALGKPFSMMAYPNRTHSISEGEGTRRHLFELMTRFLEQNLPPGPRSDH
ncbi:MAG: prolyl oligopeptidase family serine peptidase [Isosphaeraceae bacterium]